MEIEKLKNDIALKHGYQDGILGSAWNFAMQLTHRTKRQIALYEEVIEALANSSDENSGLHKHFVNGWPLEDFPDNLPLYLDSGLFQLRSDDMEEVLLQQGVNERNIDFLARCKAYR